VLGVGRANLAEGPIYTAAMVRMPVTDGRAQRLLGGETHHLSSTEAVTREPGAGSAVISMPRGLLERLGEGPVGWLSERETEVVVLAARGLPNRPGSSCALSGVPFARGVALLPVRGARKEALPGIKPSHDRAYSPNLVEEAFPELRPEVLGSSRC
jgi:hypothetical protein